MLVRPTLVSSFAVFLLVACGSDPATPESVCAEQRECFEWDDAREAECASTLSAEAALAEEAGCDAELQVLLDCMEEEACTEVDSCSGVWCPEGSNETPPCFDAAMEVAVCASGG